MRESIITAFKLVIKGLGWFLTYGGLVLFLLSVYVGFLWVLPYMEGGRHAVIIVNGTALFTGWVVYGFAKWAESDDDNDLYY